jgi:predicted metal-binding membrane protein
VIHAHPPAFAPLAAMWFGMMALMMGPTVWPWIRAFDRLGNAGAGVAARAGASAIFTSGYFAAWLIYAVAAAALQLLLARAGSFDAMRGLAPAAGAGLLALAGVFQFAPLKHACLMHCRNPLSFFLSRWRDGASGGFRMGFGHGLFCVGCCWALMATSLAVGVMSLWWMAALAAIAFVEQVVPGGDRLRIPLGVGLLIAAALRLW